MELRGGLKKCGVVADLHLPSRAVWISAGNLRRGDQRVNRRVKTGEDREDDKVMVGQEERERTQAAGQAAARKWT